MSEPHKRNGQIKLQSPGDVFPVKEGGDWRASRGGRGCDFRGQEQKQQTTGERWQLRLDWRCGRVNQTKWKSETPGAGLAELAHELYIER